MVSMVQSKVSSCTGMGDLALVVESVMFQPEGIVKTPADFPHSLSSFVKSGFMINIDGVL